MEDPRNLQIILYPDPRLRAESAPVPQVDQSIRDLVERMKALTIEAGGLGLAAPQTGINLRLFLGREPGDRDDFEVYVNPHLRLDHAQIAMEEGCLSLPDIRGEIVRPKTATIEYTDLAGRKCVRTDSDLQARMWQHENDHLNGVLILDRFGPLDKLRHRRAVKDLERRYRTQAGRTTAAVR